MRKRRLIKVISMILVVLFIVNTGVKFDFTGKGKFIDFENKAYGVSNPYLYLYQTGGIGPSIYLEYVGSGKARLVYSKPLFTEHNSFTFDGCTGEQISITASESPVGGWTNGGTWSLPSGWAPLWTGWTYAAVYYWFSPVFDLNRTTKSFTLYYNNNNFSHQYRQNSGYYWDTFYINNNLTVSIPNDWFNYIPTITVSSPVTNSAYSAQAGKSSISLSGTIYDPDVGNVETIYYRIDGTSGQAGTQFGSTITANNTSQPFLGTIDAGSLTEGSHNIYTWVQDNIGGKSAETAIPFKVDKTVPTVNAPTLVANSTSQITVQPNAADPTVSGVSAGLHSSAPYQYNKNGVDVGSWMTGNYLDSGLQPNTQYTYKYKAKDDVLNTSGYSAAVSKYTLAQTPSLTVNGATSYTLDVSTSDSNPSNTQYQIWTGTSYVTSTGSLSPTPQWITLSGKKITVTGLNPSTAYNFHAKARNGDNVETSASSPATNTTLPAPPGSPTGITAAATNNSVTLNWEAVLNPDATGYDVEADGVVINNGTSRTYTHTGLGAVTTHNYRVRARNGVVNGSWSAIVTKTTLPNPPEVPVSLNAIPGSTTVTVTWGSVPGATTYEIEVDGELLNAGTSTNYIHTGLLPGTNHAYRVRALNAGGASGWSIEAEATTSLDSINTPSNLKAVPSKNKVDVSWNLVQDAIGYDIEVDGVVIDNGTRNTYTHSSLSAGSSHTYRVRAKRGYVMSAWSGLVPVSTLPDTFGTPTNIKDNTQDTSITLTWDATAGATSYDVEFDGIVTDNATETSCTFGNLTPNTQHTYRVRAKSGDITSEWSEIKTVTTYLLPTPSNITATSTQTAITLNWIGINEATSYDVEIDGTTIQNVTENIYTLDGLTANSQHSFRVRAKNADGTGAWSSTITKTTAFNADSIPAGILTKSRNSSITVMWKALAGATGYDLEADGTIIENIAGTNYVHNGLVPGTQHTYRLRARTDVGAGDWSSIFAASTLPILPDAPSNVIASSTMMSIRVTWDSMDNVTEYEIEVDGQPINNGTGTSFIHTGLAPDTTHTYRVRAKNISGTGDWSPVVAVNTKNSTQDYTISVENNESFSLMFTATETESPSNYTFTVNYDTSELEAVDLCASTPRINLTTGSIAGTDIQILQYTPGTIVFKVTGAAAQGRKWSGIVNTIKFKSKVDGDATITYSVN